MMTTQTIKVEGLPEGYKLCDIYIPDRMIKQINSNTLRTSFPIVIVLEKIKPSEIRLVETDENNSKEDCGVYLIQQFRHGISMHHAHKIWKEVKETDASLNSDDPKLSLSLDDVNSLMRTLCEADLSLEASLLQRMRLFIKENS